MVRRYSRRQDQFPAFFETRDIEYRGSGIPYDKKNFTPPIDRVAHSVVLLSDSSPKRHI
jgi:hypothetical protein